MGSMLKHILKFFRQNSLYASKRNVHFQQLLLMYKQLVVMALTLLPRSKSTYIQRSHSLLHFGNPRALVKCTLTGKL
jgi:hypothetical protein